MTEFEVPTAQIREDLYKMVTEGMEELIEESRKVQMLSDEGSQVRNMLMYIGCKKLLARVCAETGSEQRKPKHYLNEWEELEKESL